MNLDYELACLANKIDSTRDVLDQMREDYLDSVNGDLFQVPILALTTIVSELEALRKVPGTQGAPDLRQRFKDAAPDIIAAIANVTALASTNEETSPTGETISFALMAIEFFTEYFDERKQRQ